LITIIAIIGGFVLSANITNATTDVTLECNNGPSRSNSGGCGTACVPLCDDMDFVINSKIQGHCVSEARNNTDFWAKYEATRKIIMISVPRMPASGFGWTFVFIRVAAVCSTADKCRGSECDSPHSPFLRSGSCECGPGEVGGIYKICCLRGPGGTYTPTNAREYHEQDGFPPQEGHCRGANVRTAWSQRSEDAHPGLSGHLVVRGEGVNLTCTPIGAEEVEPTISLSVNDNEINQGEFVTLSWTTTGLTTPCNITRVGPGERGGINNVQPNGSATSDPRTIGIHTYTLTCAVTNRPTETRTSPPVTVTVASVTEVPVAQRWWFCNRNNVCQQTTGQYTTAADCQAAVYRWWDGLITTCRRTEGECSCDVSPVPTPITPAPTPIISTHNDVYIDDFSVNPTCIPQQPTNRREATLSWRVRIGNECPALPNDAHTFVPGSNDSECGGGRGFWDPQGWRLTSPTSHTASCTAFGGWSGNKPLVGFHNISPPPSFTITYGLSCSRTDPYTCRYRRGYTFRNWECTTDRQGSRACRCVRMRGSVISVGPSFGPSSSSRETTLAVVQPLDRVVLTSQKDRILHKTFTNISWSSFAPSSSTPNRTVTTEIQCTPSVQANGDGTGWTGAINSLGSSGTRSVSPIRTTTYQLLCRNIYQNNRACYTYRSAPSQIIRVFTPDLREVPAFYDSLMRLVGRIGDGLR